MTKTTKPTKVRADPAANPRSRAAKRATSPSINVDKSIKDAPRASDGTPVLAATRGGGVSKKQKKKQMTRGQRVRLEKGLARAEVVMDQLEVKVDASKSRSRRQEQRRGQWENVNGAAKEETRKTTKAPGRETIEEEWEDVKKGDEEDVKEGDEEDVRMKAIGLEQPAEPTLPTSAVTDETPAAAAQDDLDLIT